MKDIYKIKHEIIKEGFPELSNLEISLKMIKSKEEFMSFNKYFWSYSIEVDKSFLKAPSRVIKGCMAHELAHLLITHKNNPLINGFDNLFYKSSETYRKWDERRTDRLVIDRGYGGHLINFLEWTNKRYEEYNEHDGLTIGEIRTILDGGKK